jgi:hypothetical protein
MKVAIVNLGAIVSGDWHSPLASGDAILINNGRITGSVGSVITRSAMLTWSSTLME